MASKKVEIIIIGKDELSSILKNAEKDMKEFGSATEKGTQSVDGLNTKTVALGSALGTIAGSFIQEFISDLKNIAKQAIEVASAYEQQEITLTRLCGSQELARQEMEKWNQESVKTPFSPSEYRDAAIQLKTYKFELSEISSYLKAAGDAAAAFQGKISLDQVINAFGRLKAGQFGEAFEQFRRLGISMQELKGEGLIFDRGGQYTGSIEKAVEAVRNIIEKNFGGMMDEQSRSFKGLTSTMQGNWEALQKTMMDKGPFEFLKKQILGINEILIELNENIAGRLYERTKTQFDQIRSSITDLEKRYQEFIKLGGEKKVWLDLGLPDFEKINEEMEKIKNTSYIIGRPDVKITTEQFKELVTETYSGAPIEWYTKLNQAIKENSTLMKANNIISKENREAIAPRAAILQKEAAALKALEEKQKENNKIADESIESYKNLQNEFAIFDIKNLTKDFEDHKRLLAEVNEGTIKLSAQGVKKLRDEYTELAITLGKTNIDFQESDMEGFIDDLNEVKKSTDELIKSFLFLSSMGTGLFAFGINTSNFEETENIVADITNEMLKWAGAIENALGALGLLTDDLALLFEGVQGVATGIGKIATGDLTGILDVLASLPSLIDGLFESFEEGFNKQFSAQGFDESLSKELIDKIQKVSDAMGGKEYGMRAYIEDIFKEVDISNADEFTHLSDLLNEQIGVYISQGHTVEEAYAQYGDELQELIDAQEQYGFETTASLDQMVKLQREQTSAGRVEGISETISGVQNMIDAMSEYGYSGESFTAVFGLLQSTFEKLKAEGLSTQEIFEKISPAVESARKAAEAAGVSTAPMDDLLQFYQMMEDAGPLFDVITGIDSALKGLSDTGTLTQSNLDALSQTTLETYRNMQAEGFSPEQIATAMGPSILEMAESAEKFGYTLPQELMDLVNIMKAEGVETAKTESEVLQEWSDEYLEMQKTYNEEFLKVFQNIAGYQEGGVIPGNENKAMLALLHGGERVIPAGANLASMLGSNQSLKPIININFSGDASMLKDFIKTSVQDLSLHGDLEIRNSSVV